MIKTVSRIVLLALSIIPATLPSALGQYQDHNLISKKLDAIAREYKEVCKVTSLVKTSEGREIWLITIGKGDTENKPAVVITGGVDGRYILGRELAAGFAEKILQNLQIPEIKELLDKITFYILPDVNPDATSQFFAGIKYERSLNSGSADDDRDFINDEDPCEDLNKDGLITLIRIMDPSGNFTQSDEDKRILVPADLSKGQKGSYLLYSEGIDNDKDGRFNEDGKGGVNFNHNFTYNYEEFGSGAGYYPVSEPESKAVADFLFDHFNVYAVIAFGPQDNLGQPMKAAERPSSYQGAPVSQPDPERGYMRRERGRITSILKTDEHINKLVSDKYHEITGAKGSPPTTPNDPGNFMDWVYYHYGRYSFSTPGWWFPVDKGKNTEAEFLKYAGKKKMGDIFVPWTGIVHPDFPEKTVEVGGIKPFSMINPPADTLGDLIDSHYRFITAVASMHPELEFLDIKVEDAGEDIFRLSLKVHNKGIFATCTEAGESNIWTRIMRIAAEPSKSQTILSGLKIQRVNRLEGNASAEFTWLISGRGSLRVTAGSVNTGQISTTIELK
jgi:hypothetical protein